MTPPRPSRLADSRRQALTVAAIVVVQALGAVFFVADAVGDIVREGLGLHIVIECLVAFSLLAGVVFGALSVRVILARAKQQDEALAVASGALADLVLRRFAIGKLTPGEADVALFALKGCSAHEIAQIRCTAEGTVRAQLTRIYAKAGVASQSALVSLFFDDLLDVETLNL
ncbi:MAG: LuxR family transcriptional regulator [Phenylobacterium zucineum]|nr:MAG: LuxR family transcriptional regulator [Phenylobacterium zucineum]